MSMDVTFFENKSLTLLKILFKGKQLLGKIPFGKIWVHYLCLC